TDALTHVTRFEYNDAGQQVKKTLPDTTTFEQFGYNAAGNMTSHRLGDGNTNTFEYDDMNRLTEIAYFDGKFANFTYTDGGQRDTASTRAYLLAPPQVYDYSYDLFQRLKQVTYPDGRAVSYTYYDNDLRETMTTQVGTTTYGYDGINRLTSVNAGASQITTFEYDPVGFLTDKHQPNGVHTEYTPNERNQLKNVISKDSSNATLLSFAYLLDPAGNRKQVTEAGGGTILWDYDNLYRLTDETRAGLNAHFEYDDAGNRDWMTVNGVTTDYTYNVHDQLISAGAITYDYDDRGNLNTITNGSQVTAYTYDAADRLISATAPGVTASYGYDADGRRVTQTFNGQVTNSLWDEASPYGDVVLETNGSGSTLASYVLGGTQLISQTRGSTTSYFLQDGQGSTRALTNSSSTVTDTHSYTAFGELFNQTGSTTNSYLYTGQQFDSLTGLYSLRARYYNPAMGRFLSQDTYPYNFGNPIELNRYVYTANDPINAMDPSGHLLIEYVTNAIEGAARGAAAGFVGGGIYGIVASMVCGGSGKPDWGYAVNTAMQGAQFGAALGGLTGAFPGLTPIVTVGAGAGGLHSAITHASDNLWCNLLNIGLSVASLAIGVTSTQTYWGGSSGGGWQLCGATCGGGTSTITFAAQGAAGNTGIWGLLGGWSMMSNGTYGSEEVPPEVQKYLDRLPRTGSMISVRPNEINLKLLADIHRYALNADEFALLEMSNGEIILMRGSITAQIPTGTVRVIAHTHYWASLHPTTRDFEALYNIGQRSPSYMVTENRWVVKFSVDENGVGTELKSGYLK
ncbi:MAG TPA: RHS repeat-associated core domain-containing protein, partial [Anaerolineales bacterium]|nr:RHS repeat-associated core domain-containing protein [Anaerolineales bacterium]